MAIKKLFKAVSEYFQTNKIDFGIIGAFALYSYGYIRATKDIDFITRSTYKNNIMAFLESLGLETLFSSDAFSNHFHPVGSVRIDIMYVDGETADEIFKSIENRLIFDNLKLPVVSPEHLIAMKLFAIKSNSERKFKDLADIKEVLRCVKCDMQAIRKYFKKYGQYEYYNEITRDLKK